MNTRKTRSNGRETMANVIECARQELDAHGPVKFNILRVIDAAQVSRSSVYHHFGGRDGLIAAVEVERLNSETRGINEALRSMIENAASRADALGVIRAVLVAAGSQEGRRLRAHRVAVIAAAQSIPLLADTLRDAQRQGDAVVAEILRLAEHRGLVSGVTNPIGVAHMISSLFAGRVIVDALDDDNADGAWIEAVMVALEALLPERSAIDS